MSGSSMSTSLKADRLSSEMCKPRRLGASSRMEYRRRQSRKPRSIASTGHSRRARPNLRRGLGSYVLTSDLKIVVHPNHKAKVGLIPKYSDFVLLSSPAARALASSLVTGWARPASVARKKSITSHSARRRFIQDIIWPESHRCERIASAATTDGGHDHIPPSPSV